MISVEFEGTNRIFTKHKEWTDEQCMSINVMVESDGITECWQPSYEDILAISAGREVFFQFYYNKVPKCSILIQEDSTIEIDEFQEIKPSNIYDLRIYFGEKDRKLILEGKPIFIKLFLNELPPIAVFTLDENGELN